MNSVGPCWRDPTFYAFLLFGVMLLSFGLLCQKQAERTPMTAAMARDARQSAAGDALLSSFPGFGRVTY